MNEVVETVALTCLHSLWIGPLIALLLALVLNVLPESQSQSRYATACFSLLGIVALSVVLARFSEPITNLRFQLSLGFEYGIATIWLGGFLISVIRFVLNWRAIRHLKIFSTPVASPGILEQFDFVKSKSSFRGRVALRASDSISGPLLIGWVFPTVLIPGAWLAGVPVGHLQAVFAHELAHATRHDFIFNVVQRILESIFFFNPAVWWIGNVIRREREHACDDFAARISNGATAYSRALVWFEAHRLASEPDRLALAFGDGGPIQSRISRLLRVSNNHNQKKLSPVAAISGVSILAMMILLVSLLIGGTRIFAKGSQEIGAIEFSSKPDPADSKGQIIVSTGPPNGEILDLINGGSTWLKPDPLFVSIPLVEKNGVVIDLRKKTPALFDEFPNSYIIKHELDFLNSHLPFLDPDNDGFTVMEEFQAGTDPKDSGAHPAYVEKLKFESRKEKNYKVNFTARPDAQRFQLTRESSAKWPLRESFILKIGETTNDGQLKILKFTEKKTVNSVGVTVDVSELTAEFVPTGEEVILVKGVANTIPIYYAELVSMIGGEGSFLVKKGDAFTVSGDSGKWTLDEVKETSCTISRNHEAGETVTKTLEMAK